MSIACFPFHYMLGYRVISKNIITHFKVIHRYAQLLKYCKGCNFLVLYMYELVAHIVINKYKYMENKNTGDIHFYTSKDLIQARENGFNDGYKKGINESLACIGFIIGLCAIISFIWIK